MSEELAQKFLREYYSGVPTSLRSVSIPSQSYSLEQQRDPVTRKMLEEAGRFKAPNVFRDDYSVNIESQSKQPSIRKQLRTLAAKYGILDKLENIQTKVSNRAGTLGTLGGTGLIVANQLNQEQPLGAAVGGLSSVVGGMIASRFGGTSPLARTLLGLGASTVVGGLAGEGAERAKAAITGAGKGKNPGGTEPPAYIPGTNIPLNETARFLESQKTLGNQEFDFYKKYSAADRAGIKDLIQYSIDAEIQKTKRLDPIVQQSKDKDMVRTQALLNTQGNIDARLGMLSIQGALAKGAQAEAGALARTFASTNPYAQFANRQSPNIQFG
jgi:hypothetical protein